MANWVFKNVKMSFLVIAVCRADSWLTGHAAFEALAYHRGPVDFPAAGAGHVAVKSVDLSRHHVIRHIL